MLLSIKKQAIICPECIQILVSYPQKVFYNLLKPGGSQEPWIIFAFMSLQF